MAAAIFEANENLAAAILKINVSISERKQAKIGEIAEIA
jgi:hypothetical protein